MKNTSKVSAFAALFAALRAHRDLDSLGLGAQLLAVPRLVSATLKGHYPGLQRGRLLAMFAALAYIVSPIDLVPESIFAVLGLGDDALLLTWLAGAVLAETDAFLRWEDGSHAGVDPAAQRVVPGEVI